MPQTPDEFEKSSKSREARRQAIEAMEKLISSIRALHDVYNAFPELNDMQPASMEKTIPMSIDEWESQAACCIEDWRGIDVNAKKAPSPASVAKPTVEELLYALNVYQKANRLKHDGDSALFDIAEPIIDRAVKAGLTVKSFRELVKEGVIS